MLRTALYNDPACSFVNRFFCSAALVVCLNLLPSGVALGHPGVGDRIHLLDDAIVKQPDNQYLYIQRALAHSENGNPQQAMHDIELASTLGDALNIAFVSGVLLYREGDFIGSRKSFDKYLSAHPDHLESLEYRARLLRDAGQDAAALSDFLRIFELNQAPNPGLYISAADLMVAVPAYGISAAISLLDTGMEKLGSVSQLQRHAIALERRQRNYSEAIRRMHQLPASLRDTPQWKIDVAELHLLQSDQASAKALLVLASAQLDKLPRNGVRDAARQDILRLEQQLTPQISTELM